MTPLQIAQIAYQAGFRGIGFITAVAVALAESGGNPNSHNTSGEDSRGLWQINVVPDGNPQYASWNLFDPLTNAKAAYQLSNGGSDWHDWTTYMGGAYKTFLAQAQSAVTGVLGGNLPGPTTTPTPDPGKLPSLPGVNIPGISIPAIPIPGVDVGSATDIPSAIVAQAKAQAQAVTNVGSGITTAIQQAIAPLTDGISNLNSLLTFTENPKSWVSLLLILLGIAIILLGIVLFAVSLIPKSAVQAVAKAV